MLVMFSNGYIYGNMFIRFDESDDLNFNMMRISVLKYCSFTTI